MATKEQNSIEQQGNMPTLHNLFRSKLKPGRGIPTLVKGSTTAISEHDKAQLLSDQFEAVFKKGAAPPPVPITTAPSPPTDARQTISQITFDKQSLTSILRKLAPKLSCGPDRLPLIFYKKTASHIADPLVKLFKKCISNGEMPALWKTATITPCYKKKGSKDDPKNYRPISLTCAVCRVFERVLAASLNEYIETFGLLSREQYGYSAKRGTEVCRVHGSLCTIKSLCPFDKKFKPSPSPGTSNRVNRVHRGLSGTWFALYHQISLSF